MGMKIERANKGIELKNASYGDVIELANGDMVLIIPDTDGNEYRGLNLSTFEYTGFYFEVANMFMVDEIRAVIPKEKVTLKIEG